MAKRRVRVPGISHPPSPLGYGRAGQVSGLKVFDISSIRVFQYSSIPISPGGEMADAPALGAGGSNPMEVQVLSRAPRNIAERSRGAGFLLYRESPLSPKKSS